jgi:hypothetical protein
MESAIAVRVTGSKVGRTSEAQMEPIFSLEVPHSACANEAASRYADLTIRLVNGAIERVFLFQQSDCSRSTRAG